MKKSSLKAKTITILIMALLFAFVIGLVFCSVFSSGYYENIKTRSLISLNQELKQTDFNKNDFREISNFCEQNSLSLLVVNPAGLPVYSYGNSSILLSRLDDITFLQDQDSSQKKVIRQEDNHTIQEVSDEHGKILYIEDWGYLDNGYVYVVRSSFLGVQREVKQSLIFFSVVCAAILIIAGIVIYFIVNYYTKPLSNLLGFVQNLNEGEFDAKYTYKHFRQDEIGLLGENLNQISEKLQSMIAELKSSNLNLENELKAKTQLEQQRKKYLSDVSHELKTPIALISGYAEGLKEGISDDPEDRAYYCDVIIDEAEKMNILIKRLSALNQLEQGTSAVSLERFDVIAVINGFLNTMSMIIAEKNVDIFFDNSYSEYVWSDEFLFEEAFMNYFNNALHHVDDKRVIRINVEKKENNKVRITIFNTGVNIPEDDLNKIWEEFYKVDQARTREYGGSGLGLSIVKAIADSLNQQCGVENHPDGVSFWIELESAAKTANEIEEPQKTEKRRIKLSDIPIWQAAVDRIKKDDSKPKPEKKVKEEKKPKKERQKKTKESKNAADQQ
ncbi:MAG: HAMP domain-containing histidine kinase [Lachnospiraceae bacterium]|nr:HAMP domain-containing histidine kinase [Lachnospiraceae bacterium]